MVWLLYFILKKRPQSPAAIGTTDDWLVVECGIQRTCRNPMFQTRMQVVFVEDGSKVVFQVDQPFASLRQRILPANGILLTILSCRAFHNDPNQIWSRCGMWERWVDLEVDNKTCIETFTGECKSFSRLSGGGGGCNVGHGGWRIV